VLTVNGDGDVVERQPEGGELACPSCGGVVGGGGHAVERRVRVLAGRDVRLRPRRPRCRRCGGTHVLLLCTAHRNPQALPSPIMQVTLPVKRP
jgi:hypothetical protein